MEKFRRQNLATIFSIPSMKQITIVDSTATIAVAGRLATHSTVHLLQGKGL